jgi:hypothetical protein
MSRLGQPPRSLAIRTSNLPAHTLLPIRIFMPKYVPNPFPPAYDITKSQKTAWLYTTVLITQKVNRHIRKLRTEAAPANCLDMHR